MKSCHLQQHRWNLKALSETRQKEKYCELTSEIFYKGELTETLKCGGAWGDVSQGYTSNYKMSKFQVSKHSA